MKIIAHTEQDKNSELITIHEALRRRERNPEEWENRTYYDVIGLRPMFPVQRISQGRRRSNFFSFKNGHGSSHGGGSKGIAHELAQVFLREITEFRFKVFGKSFTAHIANAKCEVFVPDPDRKGCGVVVDVMLYLQETCPLRPRLGDRIAVEICDTHPNTHLKNKIFRASGIAALEIDLPKNMHVKNSVALTVQDLCFLRKRIRGFLRAEIWSCTPSDPKRYFARYSPADRSPGSQSPWTRRASATTVQARQLAHPRASGEIRRPTRWRYSSVNDS